MTYQTLNTQNLSSLTDLVLYVNSQVPIFTPMILLAFGVIILISTYFGQVKIRGEGDIISCFAVASISVAVLSTIMGMIPNLINGFYIAIAYVLAFIGIAILMNNER